MNAWTQISFTREITEGWEAGERRVKVTVFGCSGGFGGDTLEMDMRNCFEGGGGGRAVWGGGGGGGCMGEMVCLWWGVRYMGFTRRGGQVFVVQMICWDPSTYVPQQFSFHESNKKNTSKAKNNPNAH